MMNTRYILTKFPVSCSIIAIIWVLCFMNVPETPLSDVRLMDKWTHTAMYLVLGLSILLEYLRTTEKASLKAVVLWDWLAPLLMGGLIEILQAYCTGGRRSGDWLDFLADGIGSTVALLIGILLVRCRARA
ncbi:MAG: VanZ family protein [Prevotella sp.]|nr:VanZ family protein [Prevotella sp.]